MKTPREILLARHQSATPKLDAIRHETVTKLSHQVSKTQSGNINLVSWCLGGLEKLWSELVLPSRRLWAGLATAWLLIITANMSMRDHSPAALAKSSVAPQVVMSFAQQERLLADLTPPGESVVAEPQKPYVPRPSSRRSFEIITT